MVTQLIKMCIALNVVHHSNSMTFKTNQITIGVKIWGKESIAHDTNEAPNIYSKTMKLQHQSAETNHDLQLENDRLKSELKEAMAEIIRLSNANSELNEECKETKLELIRVKTELRKAKLNTNNYLEWTDLEVVDWITSIHDGVYVQYEENLRLLFAKESVSGAVLSEISKPDLKDWGIHNFSDRSNLYKQIQKLVKQ
eukprot:308573_1